MTFSAEILLRQLGGNRFIAMTGARNFLKDKDSLRFKIPSAKHGINYVKITLNPKDLYDIEFGKVSKNGSYKLIKFVEDIFVDSLQEVFTSYTGLYTHL